MKITSLKTACYRIPLERVLSDSTHGRIPDFQLVTVQLRDAGGMSGLGYTYTVGYGGVPLRALVENDLQELLVGSEADDIEDLWQQMWRRLHYVGRGGLASFAISAVDIALWDLKARNCNMPLWRLLGGTQAEVPAYAGGIDLQFTEQELLAQAQQFLAAGFRAIKIKVGRADLDGIPRLRPREIPGSASCRSRRPGHCSGS